MRQRDRRLDDLPSGLDYRENGDKKGAKNGRKKGYCEQPYCPEVNQIPLHKTPQYPLPALKKDESTLEGTLEVYLANLNVMGIGDAELETHGLMFDDGDLLTDALKEKIESARQNCDTPIAGMWASNLSEWAKSATVSEFDAVSKTVFDKLFSTTALNELRARAIRDITLENNILYNRDALFYIEFTQAIKKGDIGRVLNILAIWMVMMRSPKTMPRYADAMFETGANQELSS
ncbi:hypothetical protein C8R44DRAFT_895428 [Mycena epipterygia]|nr:hypothetical protein C8R44DRAFT_895428 [Mycena epipterygia]